MSNVPKIRFKEFNDEWISKRLGDIATGFNYGMNSASKEYDGKNKYIRITDIDENTRKYIDSEKVSPLDIVEEQYKVKEGDILVARTGASVGKTYLYNTQDGDLYYAGFLIKFNVKKKYSPYFVFSQTLLSNYNNWLKVNSIRSGQPGINAEELKRYSFKCPSLPEQEKIASFLSLYDKKIELQEKKVESLKKYKKGMMQKIFSQELRFKDENGENYPDWEEHRFKNLVTFEAKSKYPASIKKAKGPFRFILSSTSSDKWYCDTPLLNKEAIIINDGGEANFVYMSGEYAYSDHCIAVSTNENTKYLYYYLDWKRRIIDIQGFTGSGLRNIDREYLKNFKINLPSLPEQEKIASLLSTIDKKIELEEKLLEKLKEYKKGLLQQMFV